MVKSELLHKVREGEFVYNLWVKGTGHDWWHIDRVVKNALLIGRQEGADLYIVELAALVHDVGDHKFHDGDDSLFGGLIKEILVAEGIDDDDIVKVIDIVEQVSYKGAEVETPMETLEGKVVQDADRLDALGAIGIARAFAYGGAKNRELYNPDKKPTMHTSFDAYKNDKGHTVNHFYEKLLLLKDRMHTSSGKFLAEERHQFMKQYLEQFYKEWDTK